MAKDRWMNDRKLNEWFTTQMDSMDEFGGDGSSTELPSFLPDEVYMGVCLEGWKDIDVHDAINGGVQFGQDAERLDAKIFYFNHHSINYYLLAKNKTELKKLILKAVAKFKEACEPIEKVEEEDSSETRAYKLLSRLRTSHLSEKKGQTDIESEWMDEIDSILKDVEHGKYL